jgi:hypothetical protein
MPCERVMKHAIARLEFHDNYLVTGLLGVNGHTRAHIMRPATSSCKINSGTFTEMVAAWDIFHGTRIPAYWIKGKPAAYLGGGPELPRREILVKVEPT